MDKQTAQYFIEGLRVAIKQTGKTHKDFAEGVTSGVNLSNLTLSAKFLSRCKVFEITT